MSLPGAALLIAALAAAPAAWSAAAPDEKQLAEMRARIERLQKQLAATEETRSEAADALRESERGISEAKRTLRDLSAQARAADARLSALRAEAATGQGTLQRQQGLLARALYHQYVGGRKEPLRLLLNREDPNRIARQLHYLAYVARARAEVIAALRASLERLKALAQETERTVQELAAIAGEQQLQQRRLEQEKTARSATLAKISREISQQRREISTLQRDEQRLTRLAQSLARLVAREPRPAPRRRNGPAQERAPDDGPFAGLKGRLALPVRGEVAGRYGAPRADGGATWKGLFIAARSGEEVRAVAGGRVVYADWLRGFGNLLIIDHGGAYMSLYGNNESLYKQVGDLIHGGEPVAAVGNSGGNPDSGLYFELRHEGRPMDPSGWVAVKPAGGER